MEQDVYQVKDIYVAALLYASQLKLLRLDRSGSSCWFIFRDRARAESLSDKYWTREADVNAKAYAEAVRSLKDMIFSRKDN